MKLCKWYFILYLIVLLLPISGHAVMSTTYLVLDQPTENQLPKRLRVMEELKVLASGQFSEATLTAAIQNIKAKITVVDLRQESHFHVDGLPVSLYALKNQANINLSNQEIEQAEINLVQSSLSNKDLMIHKIIKKTAGVINQTAPFQIHVEKAQTEADLVHNLGLNYQRFYFLDRHHPAPQEVDRIIGFLKNRDPHEWLFVHCRGGGGRTTTFLSMLEMIHSRKPTSLEQIINHQISLQGTNLLKMPTLIILNLANMI